MYRRTLLAAVLVAAFGIAACDSEPAQRKAFIEFLQTRIVGKPGVHVPKPAAEQLSALTRSITRSSPSSMPGSTRW